MAFTGLIGSPSSMPGHLWPSYVPEFHDAGTGTVMLIGQQLTSFIYTEIATASLVLTAMVMENRVSTDVGRVTLLLFAAGMDSQIGHDSGSGIVTLTGGAITAFGYTLTSTELLTLTDAVVKNNIVARNRNDAVIIESMITRDFQGARSIFDGLTSTATIAGTGNVNRVFADAGDFDSSVVRGIIATRTKFDSIPFANIVQQQAVVIRLVGDDVTLTAIAKLPPKPFIRPISILYVDSHLIVVYPCDIITGEPIALLIEDPQVRGHVNQSRFVVDPPLVGAGSVTTYIKQA